MSRSTRRPRSNRYSDDYSPDLEYIAENLGKTQDYAEYLAENLDKTVAYSEYIAEQIGKTAGEREYEKSIGIDQLIKNSFEDRYNFKDTTVNANQGFMVLSKGRDYIIIENNGSRTSHWISKDDKLLDSDNYEYDIISYNLMPVGLYVLLDGHLKVKEGDTLYIK